MVFPDWENIFHLHMNVLSIVIGSILVDQGEGVIYHLVYFSISKLF
jgi:hypothetical protein